MARPAWLPPSPQGPAVSPQASLPPSFVDGDDKGDKGIRVIRAQ